MLGGDSSRRRVKLADQLQARDRRPERHRAVARGVSCPVLRRDSASRDLPQFSGAVAGMVEALLGRSLSARTVSGQLNRAEGLL